MKRKILIITFTIIVLSGCATKNKAYQNLEKSPCACFETTIKVG
ncbi:hypothetical protein [Malaciobacter marinus]|jgi:PBP1b-binding outer membrane lipoprotein LpoB|nr:hypothetical protein [Malaciobacter marinus]SKB73268.1 hypothetical protein SAMN06295997_13624 [Malaciobacter marinus]